MVKLLKPTTPQELAMLSFIQRFSSEVIGSLSGFDRLRFRGTKRLLNSQGGMHTFLWHKQVLLKDFKSYVCDVTDSLRRSVEHAAAGAGRPLIFLNHGERKEDLAQRVAQRDGVSSGLICVFSAVESCFSWSVHPDRASKRLVLEGGPKKCLHYSHYSLAQQLGLMHARLQTWFPFAIQVCLNGREWLARQMDQAGIGYVKKDNCFVDVQDLQAAQALLDSQLETDWPALLCGVAALSNPAEREIFGDFAVPYYWSVDESEWATDFMFRSAEALAA